MSFRMPVEAPSRGSSWRSSPLDRRRFIRGAGASLGLVAAPALVSGAFAQARWRGGDPFSLGVASGAPRPDGFVLWTRLAPDPLSPDPATPGGMTGGDVPVTYEIASDPQMHDIVRRGAATAEARYAHSVHADIRGLPPGRSWWYRFVSGDAASPIGRAVTTVPAGTALPRLRFGFVSCSNYEFGYFSAYRHLADENPDVVLYLGDYFYEYIEQVRPTVRAHSDGVEAATLPTYRNRYAQYRLDPDLQRLHATAPALVTWDDHEVSNDYAGKYSQFFDEPELFLLRRAAAYQAFYEHMPVRPILSRPDGPVMRIYDRFTFGDLLEVSMIDGRQYRSRAACYAPPNKLRGHLETDATCPERRDDGRTMLGFAQEAWLDVGLARSKAQWNLIAQDVLMAQLRQKIPHRQFRLLDRRLGRLSRRAAPAAGAHRADEARQPRSDRRRHPLLLRQRPAGRFRRSEFAGDRHRVRRHVDHLAGRALRPDHRGAARQPACPFLREPQARLCQRRPRAQGDDDAHARHLRRDRPAGERVDLEDVRGGKRQAGGRGRVRAARQLRCRARIRNRPDDGARGHPMSKVRNDDARDCFLVDISGLGRSSGRE